jgi:uncharacterized membrane protein
MAFVDDLALVEALLGLIAVLFAYAGVRVWWAIRTNDAKDLRAILRGMAVPAGALGSVILLMAMWGEMAWPFPGGYGLAGYNIFFFDPMVLLGAILVAYAVSAAYGAKMQYVGLMAFVAGIATAFYGWTGYTASPAFTKDPFDTFLLYGAFAGMAVFTFPATVAVDHFLDATERGVLPFSILQRFFGHGAALRAAQRGAQPVVPGLAPTTPEAVSTYRCPSWVQTLVLLLPLFAALAAIASFWYFGTTLPGHLGAGPGAAP